MKVVSTFLSVDKPWDKLISFFYPPSNKTRQLLVGEEKGNFSGDLFQRLWGPRTYSTGSVYARQLLSQKFW